MEEVQRRNVPALGVTVAVLAIFIGVSTLMAPAIYAALGVSVPLDTTAYYMIQGAASLLLGFLGTRKRPTAFFFIALLYLPQSCTFQTPEFFFNFTGPVSIAYGLGLAPGYDISVNLLALFIIGASAWTLYRLSEPALPAGEAQPG